MKFISRVEQDISRLLRSPSPDLLRALYIGILYYLFAGCLMSDYSRKIQWPNLVWQV